MKFKIPLWNYNSITIIQQHLIIGMMGHKTKSKSFV